VKKTKKIITFISLSVILIVIEKIIEELYGGSYKYYSAVLIFALYFKLFKNKNTPVKKLTDDVIVDNGRNTKNETNRKATYKIFTKKNYIVFGSFIIILIILVLYGSNRNNGTSFRSKQKVKSSTKEKLIRPSHFDSIKNIYYDYKNHFSYNIPSGWIKIPQKIGIVPLEIIQPDSLISASVLISIIKNKKSNKNIWNLYDEDPKGWDNELKSEILKKQLKFKDFKTEKDFIKSNYYLIHSYKTVLKISNVEYEFINIIYSTYYNKNNTNFIFKVEVPAKFYNMKPKYYKELIYKFHFIEE